MKRTLIALTVSLLATGASAEPAKFPPRPHTWIALGADTVGCKGWGDFEELARLQMSDKISDQNLAGELLGIALNDGEGDCQIYPAGTVLFVEEERAWGLAMQVRPNRTGPGYWVPLFSAWKGADKPAE